MIFHVRAVENTVNDGEGKVEGATPSCLSWAPRQWVVGDFAWNPLPLSLARESRDAGKHCVTLHAEYSNFAHPTTSSSTWRLPTADPSFWVQCSPVWSSCLSGQHATSPLPERVSQSPLLCRGWRNEISHVGCSNVAMQCAFRTVCVAS